MISFSIFKLFMVQKLLNCVCSLSYHHIIVRKWSHMNPKRDFSFSEATFQLRKRETSSTKIILSSHASGFYSVVTGVHLNGVVFGSLAVCSLEQKYLQSVIPLLEPHINEQRIKKRRFLFPSLSRLQGLLL